MFHVKHQTFIYNEVISMSKKSKFSKALLFGTCTAGVITIINKLISINTSKSLFPTDESLKETYSWRFGDIRYIKSGHGKPLLLIHDLKTASSSYEWHKIIKALAKNHTVYALDLLGCGNSEKPNLTYTNFLYVQLLTDFIKNVIGRRTDVAASGSSCSFVITACNNNESLFDKLILINPDSVLRCSQTPNHYVKLYKFFLDLPVIGTLIYNIANSRRSITEKFLTENYANPCRIDPETIKVYHEMAHRNDPYGKALYASIKSNYTNLPITNALKNIDQSIYLICGEYEPQHEELLREYTAINPAAEGVVLKETAHLPQLEDSKAVAELIEDFLNER